MACAFMWEIPSQLNGIQTKGIGMGAGQAARPGVIVRDFLGSAAPGICPENFVELKLKTYREPIF